MLRSLQPLAILTFGVGLCVGCDDTPTSPDVRGPRPMVLTSVSPVAGSTVGGTAARLSGTGFGASMTLTVGGSDVGGYALVNSTTIDFTVPPHAPGAVDIVLTTPKGETSQLAGGFTYVYSPPPVVTDLSPARISTEGSQLYIKGTGFAPGTRVTIDGAVVSAFFYADTLFTSAPPHPAGTVDVVVTIWDGQAVRLPGALAYAPPGSFDFNGDWEGYADDGSHDDTVIRFTIRDNIMVSLSCGTGADLLPVPAPTVALGKISSANGSVTGRITSDGVADGRINIAPCGAHVWGAGKK